MDISPKKQSDPLINLEFCSKLPKIELHAHLNGCVRRQTLHELALAKGLVFNLEDYLTRDLNNCFKIFDIIHKVLIDLESIKRVTREMLEDFMKQNVVYLEIRTTPKSRPELYTYEEYLEGILGEIISFNKENSMIVKLIFSIDRSRTIEQAKKTLELLEKFKANPSYSQYILGLDYSGNPYKNSFRDFLAFFNEAKLKGFKTVIHVAETEGEVCKQESLEILEFKPDRLGHFNYFDNDLLNLALKLRIPLEVCPTSNYFTLGLKNMKDHHFGILFKEKYPMSICTDDTGVFDTDLSREIYEVFKAFELNREEITDFYFRSLECILEEDIRKNLQQKFNEYFNNK